MSLSADPGEEASADQAAEDLEDRDVNSEVAPMGEEGGDLPQRRSRMGTRMGKG